MEIQSTGEKCPQCDSDLVYRYNRKTSQRFIGCSSFPKCRFLKPDPDAKKFTAFMQKMLKKIVNNYYFLFLSKNRKKL